MEARKQLNGCGCGGLSALKNKRLGGRGRGVALGDRDTTVGCNEGRAARVGGRRVGKEEKEDEDEQCIVGWWSLDDDQTLQIFTIDDIFFFCQVSDE